mgnify:FL=1
MKDFGFAVLIRRSARRRKSIGLRVTAAGVEIQAPATTSQRYLEELIEQKQAWIHAKLASFTPTPPKELCEGELFEVLGTSYPLAWGTPRGLINGHLVTPRARSLHGLHRWYRDYAQDHVQSRCEYWAARIGVDWSEIRVRTYRARWGSCSVAGVLSFNWRLIQAPPAVVDYVVIHELCHRVHHNHSAAFWSLVEQFDPQWRAHRDWLKAHQTQLSSETF